MKGTRRNDPSKEEWVSHVTRHASAMGLSVTNVLAGVQDRAHSEARWRAFRSILQERPKTSFIGLARTSGFDHTTIMYAVRKMAERDGPITYPYGVTKSQRAKPSSPAPVERVPASRYDQRLFVVGGSFRPAKRQDTYCVDIAPSKSRLMGGR